MLMSHCIWKRKAIFHILDHLAHHLVQVIHVSSLLVNKRIYIQFLGIHFSIGHTTPAASLHGSDDEDSVDDEQELQELGLNGKH